MVSFEASIIGREFVGNDSVAMILGDNILFWRRSFCICRNFLPADEKVALFSPIAVDDPQRYGVVESDSKQALQSLISKARESGSPIGPSRVSISRQ